MPRCFSLVGPEVQLPVEVMKVGQHVILWVGTVQAVLSAILLRNLFLRGVLGYIE